MSLYSPQVSILDDFTFSKHLSICRTDWDAGFVEGRQYGRGKTGGQVGEFSL